MFSEEDTNRMIFQDLIKEDGATLKLQASHDLRSLSHLRTSFIGFDNEASYSVLC